jgi:hypothetical protein
MAQVANCPQCSRDLLIDDGTDKAAWARCPECRAFFQVKTASVREIPSALMVGRESGISNVETVFTGSAAVAPAPSPSRRTLSCASLATISDFQAPAANAPRYGAHAEPRPESQSSDSIDIELIPDDPGQPAPSANGSDATQSHLSIANRPTVRRTQITENPEDITDRVDKWFRSEKARIDFERNGNIPGTIEANSTLGAGTEVEVELETPGPNGPPRWDDPEHKDRLLEDVERTLDEQDELESREDADESEPEDREIVPVRRQTSESPPDLFLPLGHARRRKRSAVPMLAGIVVSGVIGLALGYYVLLLLMGSSGDFLNLAQYLPSAVLPAEFRPVLVVRTDADDRGEVQTTYTVPVEQQELEETAATAQEVVAPDEPRPFDGDAARPLDDEPAMPAGELESPPSFTADELAAALRTAEGAQPGLVAGDLGNGQQVQRTKGSGYSLLCDLAQKLAFVDAASRTDYVEILAERATMLFRRTLADQHTRHEVAVIVRMWIKSPHRKHGGVFFGGTVARNVEQGSVAECQFDLGDGQTLTVLVPPAAAGELSDSAQPLGVVGWIVDNPAEQVSGYTGDAQQAVWARQLIPL